MDKGEPSYRLLGFSDDFQQEFSQSILREKQIVMGKKRSHDVSKLLMKRQEEKGKKNPATYNYFFFTGGRLRVEFL